MGLNVPYDLAIIGFNNDPVASIIEPSLSSISHPASKMGELSAKCILDNFDSVENGGQLDQTTILDTQLIIRKSSSRKITIQH